MSAVAIKDETAPKTSEAPKLKPLNETTFHGREFRQNCWVAFVEKTITPDDLLDRDFWANVAAKLRAPDKVVVMREDRAWYREMVVFQVANTWAVLRPIGDVVYAAGVRGGPLPRPEDDYEVTDLGLNKMWGVTSRKTGQVLKGDGTLKTRESAEAWLRDWIKAQSGVSKMT
jgi:hypothetical protein